MVLSTNGRFAVIDEKLGGIDQKLDSIQLWMSEHDRQHKQIENKLSRQDVINGVLTFVSGAICVAVIGVLVKLFAG